MIKQTRTKQAITLIEMMIALTILSIVLGITYTSYIALSQGFSLQNFIEEVQYKTEMVLFKLSEELQETNPYYVWVKSYADPLFGNEQKIMLAFAVPRDQNNNFTMKSNYYPDYKKIIIYYPYKSGNETQLKRYEVYNFPSYYLQTGFSLTAMIDSNNITLPNMSPIPRKSGDTVINDLREWTIVDLYQTGSPLRATISISPSTLPGVDNGTYSFSLSTYMGARNKN